MLRKQDKTGVEVGGGGFPINRQGIGKHMAAYLELEYNHYLRVRECEAQSSLLLLLLEHKTVF